MGAGVNKQYLALAGKPILAHTLELFDRHPAIEHIYPILPPQELDYCQQQIIAPYRFDKIRKLVPGGAERQDSVRNGLRALQEDSLDQPERVVLIHDGARPLFDGQLLPELLDRIAETGAAIVAVPAKDTIKEVESGIIVGTPQRQRLWQAQTPQGARYQLLNDAFARAAADKFLGTDEASLLERCGWQVAVVSGSYQNIKVTTPDDLVVATALLDSRS